MDFRKKNNIAPDKFDQPCSVLVRAFYHDLMSPKMFKKKERDKVEMSGSSFEDLEDDDQFNRYNNELLNGTYHYANEGWPDGDIIF